MLWRHLLVSVNEAQASQTEKSSEEQKYEIYLKGIQTPVMVIDKDFSILYMNQFGRKLVKEKKSTIVGKKMLWLIQNRWLPNWKVRMYPFFPIQETWNFSDNRKPSQWQLAYPVYKFSHV